MLRWLTARKDEQRSKDRLYETIVAQSRLPVFFQQHRVPDTVTGRFEMIVLHMFLVLERLQSAQDGSAQAAERLGKLLNEAFVADMDGAMREMGVADVRVGERMHQAAGAYFGRLMAYRKALATPSSGTASALAPTSDALADAIARNILVDVAGGELAARSLAAYTRAAGDHLAGQPFEDLAAGIVTFPLPDDSPVAIARPSIG
jgi:cytochrome b pre-mRNA-processing protein 3